MGTNPIVKKLIQAKLTHTSDGLLFDFCAREKWKAAELNCKESIERREKEVEFLKILQDELKELENNNVHENIKGNIQQQK